MPPSTCEGAGALAARLRGPEPQLQACDCACDRALASAPSCPRSRSHPDDHVAILSRLRANMGGALPTDFVAWMEVLTGGEGDMLVCDTNSGYNYGGYLEGALVSAGFTEAEMLSVKLWADYYPKQPTLDCGNVNMARKAIQNDDADQQAGGSTSRDMVRP